MKRSDLEKLVLIACLMCIALKAQNTYSIEVDGKEYKLEDIEDFVKDFDTESLSIEEE